MPAREFSTHVRECASSVRERVSLVPDRASSTRDRAISVRKRASLVRDRAGSVPDRSSLVRERSTLVREHPRPVRDRSVFSGQFSKHRRTLSYPAPRFRSSAKGRRTRPAPPPCPRKDENGKTGTETPWWITKPPPIVKGPPRSELPSHLLGIRKKTSTKRSTREGGQFPEGDFREAAHEAPPVIR